MKHSIRSNDRLYLQNLLNETVENIYLLHPLYRKVKIFVNGDMMIYSKNENLKVIENRKFVWHFELVFTTLGAF